jgi:PAS domain S-box-containing protein
MKAILKKLVVPAMIFLLAAPLAAVGEHGVTDRAVPAVSIHDALDNYPLGSRLEVLEDPSGTLTVEQAVSDKSLAWKQSSGEVPGYGFTASRYWVRFTAENGSDRPIEWFLEIAYPMLDLVHLYVPKADGGFSKRVSGDMMPVPKREIQHRNFIFPMVEAPRSRTTRYLMFSTTSSMNLALYAWSPRLFLARMNAELPVLWIFFGLMLSLVIFNLFLFASAREMIYIYYVLYIASFSILLMILDGLAFQYLWPDSTWWGNISLPFFIFAAYCSGAQFCRIFLQLSKNSPLVNRVLIVFQCLAAAGMALSFVMPYSVMIKAATALSLMAVLPLVASVRLSLRGMRQAHFFNLGWAAVLTGILLYSMKTFGILPHTFITNWSMQLGCAAQFFFLALSLTDRINILKNELLSLNRDLERKVWNRTSMYLEKNERLEIMVAEFEKAQADLRRSEERYRTIIESIKEGYYEVDVLGNFTFANEALLESLGRGAGEVMGRNYGEFMTPEMAEQVFKSFNLVYRGEIGESDRTINYQVLWKDGTVRDAEVVIDVVRDAAGQITGFRGLSRDITERVAAERALMESQEQYRKLVDNANDVIYRNDWRGNFIYMNPSGLKMLGYTLDELRTMNYVDIIPPEYRERELGFYKTQLKSKIRQTNHEMPLVNKSGGIIWIEQSVEYVRNDDGSVEFFGIGREITEKKRAEEELRQSEEKYRTIIEGIKEGYYEVDVLGNVTFVNDSLCAILGYSYEELTKMKYSDFMDPGDVGTIFRIFNEVYTTGTHSEVFDWRYITKPGESRIAEGTASLITSSRGDKAGFRGILRDITERKIAEEALRLSEERYRNIIENATDGIFRNDVRGNFLYVNPSGLKHLGYSTEEILTMNYRSLVPEEVRDGVFGHFRDQIECGLEETYIEFPVRRKDGDIIWLGQRVGLEVNARGDYEFFGISRDVTARRRAEDALRASEEKYRTILQSIKEGYYETDLSGNLTFFNDALCEIWGIAPEDIRGVSFKKYIGAGSAARVQNAFNRAFREEKSDELVDWQITRADGREVFLSASVNLVRDAAGNVTGFRGMIRDVTERKRAEEALIELDRQKSRFFANISHEIRTPLTLILSPIESVLQGDYLKPIGPEFYRNIHRNGIKLLRLINNLLDISKIEAGKMSMRVQEVDIVTFLKNYTGTVRSAAESRGISLDFRPERDHLLLYLDLEKMDKVVMNLFSNALKFTGAEGRILLSVEELNDRCRIKMADTGEGIPAQSLQVIFDRFGQADTSDTRRHEGTGIGLSLAKELVEMHGGAISVESRHIVEHPGNHGTVFTVEIPRGKAHFEGRENVEIVTDGELEESVTDHRFIGMREMSDMDAPSGETKAAAGNGRNRHPAAGSPKVLVVDDNADMRNFLEMLLEKEYQVLCAENGLDGLEKAHAGRPDLIITDVMMPVMDGYEMTKRVKHDDDLKQVPVIMITAKADIANKIEGLEYGADDYLTKPFNSKELLTRVRSLLKSYEYEKIIVRRNREMENDLETARLLQQRLLPERAADISGYRYHAIYFPMDKVGGDFYDYSVREGFIDIFIADVSGHGLPGAFLSMIAKMALESITDRNSASRVQYLLNDVIYRSTVKSNYVTSFFCSLDTRKNRLRYYNAGHCPPILYRKSSDSFLELNSKGKPLGWFKNIILEEKSEDLLTGDRIIFYTDGITESLNRDRDLFGDERLRDFIRSGRELAPEEFTGSLLERVKEFSGSDKFDDDLTLLVFDVL